MTRSRRLQRESILQSFFHATFFGYVLVVVVVIRNIYVSHMSLCKDAFIFLIKGASDCSGDFTLGSINGREVVSLKMLPT